MTKQAQPTSIEVQNLTKVYKLYNKNIDRLKEALHPFRKPYSTDFYALHNINFSVSQGDTVGIIGKNGSGKSTLLKIITGVLTASHGQAKVDGKIASILELGAGFNPELTGLENIFFHGSILGFSRKEIEEKLEDIIEFANIGTFIHQPVKMYSSGMFVRLAFAVAISVDPDILIVDEALAVGDINFQNKCYKRFQDLQEKNKTILFVTHSLDSIIRYCNKAIVIDAGVQIMEGTPKEAVDVYKKLMVGCYNPDEPVDEKKEIAPKPETAIAVHKQHFEKSSDSHSYGNQEAEIIDYAILDENNSPASKILGGEVFKIRFKVRFHKMIKAPILAFTIKDIKGLEITGTNTRAENIKVGEVEAGQVIEIEFKQLNTLRSGQYALSLGCTGFAGDEFTVFHRLYDIILFEVLSDKEIVALYDLRSEITLHSS